MGLWDLITVVCIFVGLGFIILARLKRKSPKSIEWLKQFMPDKLVEKIEQPKLTKEQIMQTYSERRSMI